MNKDAFISHSSRDSDIAATICSLLEDRGVACWIAPRDVGPGRNYDEEIVAGIESTRAVIVLLSEGSNESKHVKRELDLAINQGSAILPIRIQNVLPGRGIKYFLAGKHWVDAWQPPIERAIDSVAAAIRALSAPEPGARTTPVGTDAPAHAISSRGSSSHRTGERSRRADRTAGSDFGTSARRSRFEAAFLMTLPWARAGSSSRPADRSS
jgi:hypothetical protein